MRYKNGLQIFKNIESLFWTTRLLHVLFNLAINGQVVDKNDGTSKRSAHLCPVYSYNQRIQEEKT